MKKIIIPALAIFLLAACGEKNNEKLEEKSIQKTDIQDRRQNLDSSFVYSPFKTNNLAAFLPCICVKFTSHGPKRLRKDMMAVIGLQESIQYDYDPIIQLDYF